MRSSWNELLFYTLLLVYRCLHTAVLLACGNYSVGIRVYQLYLLEMGFSTVILLFACLFTAPFYVAGKYLLMSQE